MVNLVRPRTHQLDIVSPYCKDTVVLTDGPLKTRLVYLCCLNFDWVLWIWAMYIDVHSYLSQSAIDPFAFAWRLHKSHQKLRLKHFDGKITRNRKLIKGIKAGDLGMGIAILICFLWWRVKQVITCVLGHPLKTPCCFMKVFLAVSNWSVEYGWVLTISPWSRFLFA